jgi:hypothetical protein
MTDEEARSIVVDSRRDPPRTILAKLLDTNPHITIKKRDIYNAKVKWKNDQLSSLIPIENLLQSL